MVKIIKIGEEEEVAPIVEEETQVEDKVIETNVEDEDSRIAKERLRIGIIDELQEDKQALRSSVLGEIHEDYKEKQNFVKKVYYSMVFILYIILCLLLANSFMNYEGEEFSFWGLVWYTILLAIILPLVLIFMGLVTSGGVLIGIFMALTYGLLGLSARFIMKVLGFDVELIFPELVGHRGVVTKYNALRRLTSYNLSVEIPKAGLYGNSFWHGNNIAAKSEGIEIPVGTTVKVIEASYWSFGALIRNSPVLTVIPI